VRIAVIERFSDPSRTCDTKRVGADGGDDIHVVQLCCGGPLTRLDSQSDGSLHSIVRILWSEARRFAPLLWRCIRSLAEILTDSDLSIHDKRRLIASGLATRGGPLAALAGARDIVRLLRSMRFDRIDCFSLRGFALVPLLGEVFNIPHRDYLFSGTRYFGEFTFELLAVVPYAYWLHSNGRLLFTQGCADTRCLYYFSPAHEELVHRRSYVPITEYPSARTSRAWFDVHAFPEHLDTTKWVPPPYKAIYRNQTFRWPKELCIICNKYTSEPSAWFRRAVNFLPVPLLLDLLQLLTAHYQVIYVRPQPQDIVGDHQPIRDLGEFEAIRSRFPDVLTIQQIHACHPELSFNELQIRLFANCERFVSVLGGSALLASYFGGTNIVYAREGWEVSCNAYDNWYHLFSGAKVLHAGTHRQLRDIVRREFAS